MKAFAVLAVICATALAPMAVHAQPASDRTPRRGPQPVETLPFTQEEDVDGARWVWFIVSMSVPFPYVPARDYPTADHVRMLSANEMARSGDIAWWPNFVAIYDAEKDVYISAPGSFSTKAVNEQRGKPRFFRIQVQDP